MAKRLNNGKQRVETNASKLESHSQKNTLVGTFVGSPVVLFT